MNLGFFRNDYRTREEIIELLLKSINLKLQNQVIAESQYLFEKLIDLIKEQDPKLTYLQEIYVQKMEAFSEDESQQMIDPKSLQNDLLKLTRQFIRINQIYQGNLIEKKPKNFIIFKQYVQKNNNLKLCNNFKQFLKIQSEYLFDQIENLSYILQNSKINYKLENDEHLEHTRSMFKAIQKFYMISIGNLQKRCSETNLQFRINIQQNIINHPMIPLQKYFFEIQTIKSSLLCQILSLTKRNWRIRQSQNRYFENYQQYKKKEKISAPKKTNKKFANLLYKKLMLNDNSLFNKNHILDENHFPKIRTYASNKSMDTQLTNFDSHQSTNEQFSRKNSFTHQKISKKLKGALPALSKSFALTPNVVYISLGMQKQSTLV